MAMATAAMEDLASSIRPHLLRLPLLELQVRVQDLVELRPLQKLKPTQSEQMVEELRPPQQQLQQLRRHQEPLGQEEEAWGLEEVRVALAEAQGQATSEEVQLEGQGQLQGQGGGQLEGEVI